MSQHFNNNHNSFNVSNHFTVADHRSAILAWLSPLDPKLRHQDIRERRVGNIGEWLLETDEFRSWCTGSGGSESNNAVLFCSGDPGVGKTFISSLVIDRLCDQAGGQNATVACYYFDLATQKEQSSTSMLRALLKQLVGGLEETPEEISRAYEDQRSAVGGREPGPSDITKMLQVTTSKKSTFICIDALDECSTAHRVKALDSLKLVIQNSPGTRIFVTGRPQVGPEMGRRLSGRVISVSITPRIGDIVSYLRTRLDEDTDPDAMDSSLEADILKKIPKEIPEIFLLVSLNIDAILQETTISRRRQRLCAMTDGVGLGDAYGTTLGRIKGLGGERSRLGMAALMWITHSERPLKPDELCHAVAVEIGSPNLDSDNVPSIGILLACCQGLATVDEKASTVRLIHFTVQEYLRAQPELFGPAHAMMAETCLSYLNSHQVKALSASSSPNLPDTPFLEYSSLFWGVHAKQELSECAKSLALKLFDDHHNYIPRKILLKTKSLDPCLLDFDKLHEFSGLHCASFFGIIDIVASLVDVEGCDINQNDCVGNTPLIWAARNGHEGVVNMLLGRNDVNPNKPDNHGGTPLIWAARNGNGAVVKILLGRGDLNLNEPDNHGWTPLLWAVLGWHHVIVKILLGRDDVNPDKPDNHGRTPLGWAALYGDEGMVKLLLGRGNLNPNEPENDGWTPLIWAARLGREGVVKILLGLDDVDPNQPSKDGMTPLGHATQSRQEGVVKLLFGRDDIIPHKPDNGGRTPLHWAACCGYEGLVTLLLSRSDINPNQPCNRGETPLYVAAVCGSPGVVALLQPLAFPTPGTV